MADKSFHNATQRLNLITSEIQESFMKTRMQPIENVFGKFPRIIRDLCNELGKHIRLETLGNETELDRTIIEAIKDPLTHIIRNSVDHGIEMPDPRESCRQVGRGGDHAPRLPRGWPGEYRNSRRRCWHQCRAGQGESGRERPRSRRNKPPA
ncbi:MAG: hypothetical protein QM796_18185 [Chthoniobacteraceae bacterium]